MPLNRFISFEVDFLPTTVTDQIEETEPQEKNIESIIDNYSSDDIIPLNAYKKRMKLMTEVSSDEKILAV